MSITHHHMLAVLNTEINRRGLQQGKLRVLDVGCGTGAMAEFIVRELPLLQPGIELEYYGYDVGESNVQDTGAVDVAVQRLQQAAPAVDWSQRLRLHPAAEPWPYADNTFDFIISNQVFEHVVDHAFVLEQIHRTLSPEGLSVHIFPLKEVMHDGHLKMPFVHWIDNHDALRSYIRLMSKMRIGTFPRQNRRWGTSLERYCDRHTDFIIHETNYRSQKEFARLAKDARLRISYPYTKDFYTNRLRLLLKQPPLVEYKPAPLLWSQASFALAVRLSSITMVLDKRNAYTR